MSKTILSASPGNCLLVFFSKRFGNIRSGSAGSDKVDSTFAVIVFGEVEAAFVA